MLLPLLPALVSQPEPRLIYPTRPHIVRPSTREVERFDPSLACLPGLAGIAGFSGSSAAITAASFIFNGSSSIIEKSSSVVSAYPFSVAAWIKPDAGLPSTAAFAVGGIGSATTARLSLTDPSGTAGNNVVSVQSTNAAGTTATGAGPTNWTPGAWALVVGVWAASNSRKAYFDTTAGTTNTGGSSTDLTSYSRTNFGGSYVGGSLGRFFTGKMAYMGMWNVALDATDVANLHGGALPTAVKGANLVFYPVWSGGSVIDQISGTTLTATAITSDADLPF